VSSKTGPGALPFIAVIPARRASTRLQDKALADIHGKPMVVRVAERALQSAATRVLVATDDRDIAAACATHGIECIMTRTDHPSGTDRIAEVAMALALDDDSLVVNVQGDEPLIDPKLIDQCAAHLAAAPDCAIATACHGISDRAELFNTNVVKVISDRNGRALYFSRAPIPWDRAAHSGGFSTEGNRIDGTRTEDTLSDDTRLEQPAQTVLAMRHIGLYAYRAGFLKRFPTLEMAPLERLEALEQLRALWHGFRIIVFEAEHAPAPGVDTVEDLAAIRLRYAALHNI